jgi:hypothetical protein
VTRSRPSRSRTGVRGGGGRSGETHGLNRIRHTRARDLITTRGAASVASAAGEVSVCPPYHRNHTCGYTRVKEVATRPRIAAPNERGRPPARRRRSVCRARFRGRSAEEETRPKRVEKAATAQPTSTRAPHPRVQPGTERSGTYVSTPPAPRGRPSPTGRAARDRIRRSRSFVSGGRARRGAEHLTCPADTVQWERSGCACTARAQCRIHALPTAQCVREDTGSSNRSVACSVLGN